MALAAQIYERMMATDSFSVKVPTSSTKEDSGRIRFYSRKQESKFSFKCADLSLESANLLLARSTRRAMFDGYGHNIRRNPCG